MPKSLAEEIREQVKWEDIPYLKSGFREFNFEQDFPKMLREILPGFDFAFFTLEDVDDRRMRGWAIFKPEWLGDQWRNRAPVRLLTNLSDKGGYLMYKEKVLCLMPTEERQKVMKKQMQRAEERYRAAAKGERTQQELPKGAAVSDANLELEKQLPGEEAQADVLKKRGRPRKET